ncbi:MAG: glycoside hydrolase family 9 protein, partial [Bacteroidota bacterium]
MRTYPLVAAFILAQLLTQAAPAMDKIAASQIGYALAMKKQFSSPVQFSSFEIKRVSDNTTVFTGGAPIRQVTSSLIGGATVWIGDFTALTTPGRYKIVAGTMESYPFNIGTNVFDQPVRAAQRMFYYQRAFTAITMPSAEGPWVHPTDIDKAPTGVVKGWHDAGDYAVYMPTMAQAIFWLLETWSDFGPLDDNTNIPESGNGIPDLLDETRWGLEWVKSMQDPNGGFWGSACPGCTNIYYYGTSFPHTISPYCKSIPPTVQNTAKAIAVLAYASAVYAPYDAAFANSCLSAAQAGWTWLVNNPTATNDAGPCGAYEQGSDATLLKTNRMWAAAAMVYATGNPLYETAFQNNFEPIGWISSYSKSDAFAGSLYLRAPAGANQTTKNSIKQQIFQMSDGVRSDATAHPFQFATHYYWGCNSNAMHRSGQFSWRAYGLD